MPTPKSTSSSAWSDFGTVILKFKCKFCSFEAGDQLTLRVHSENVHGNRTMVSIIKKPTISISGTSIPPVNSSVTVTSSGAAKVAGSDNLSRSTLLTQHKIELGLQNTATEVFLCSECNVAFTSEEQLCAHMYNEHDLEAFSEDFSSAVKSQQDTKPLPMSDTSSFSLPKRKSAPPKHLTSEGGAVVPKKYRKDPRPKCQLCEVRFEQEEVVKIHEQCHNTNVYVVEGSNENTGHSTNEERTCIKGYTCILCLSLTQENKGKVVNPRKAVITFKTWGQCATHLWQEHKIDCDLHSCNKCNFKSYSKSYLTRHKDVHGVSKILKCQTCHKTFKQQSQLRNHEKYHKEKSTKFPPKGEERWYTPKECPICQRILSDQKCLKRHISFVHNKLKQNVCNICGHMSARKAEMQLHLRQHTGEKPFHCTYCPFKTRDHNSLRKHKLRHTRDNLYKCPHCDYSCIQTYAFKKHILGTHPDKEGVFICKECTFMTVNVNLYEDHVKDHAEGRIPSRQNSENHNESNSSSSTTDTDSSLQPQTDESQLGGGQITVRTKSWLQAVSSDEESSREDDEANDFGVTIPATESNVQQAASEGQ